MVLNPVFHEGELAVQEKAGVRPMAQRVGKAIKPVLPRYAAGFLGERPYVIVSSVNDTGQVWTSFLAGEPGFVQVLDEVTVRFEASPERSDPLYGNLVAGSQVGVIAINLAARERMRLNGYAHLGEDGAMMLAVTQAYGNCPKYIQRRNLTAMKGGETAVSQLTIGAELSEEQRESISAADTFFVGTAHPERGADSSHRGGNAGFAQVVDAQTIVWPDYAGNMMFNTLGNIATNPQTGLLFLDFENGRTLQLTGRAEIIWDEAQIAHHVGAERLVSFVVEEVRETENVLPFRWAFRDFSPVNP